MEQNAPKFLTIRQTADTGILSEHHLRMMVKQGKLPGIYAGTKFMVNYELLVKMLDRESEREKEQNKQRLPVENWYEQRSTHAKCAKCGEVITKKTAPVLYVKNGTYDNCRILCRMCRSCLAILLDDLGVKMPK